MLDMEELYIKLMAAIADAIEDIEQQNYGTARKRLIRAMKEADHEYIFADEA